MRPKGLNAAQNNTGYYVYSVLRPPRHPCPMRSRASASHCTTSRPPRGYCMSQYIIYPPREGGRTRVRLVRLAKALLGPPGDRSVGYPEERRSLIGHTYRTAVPVPVPTVCSYLGALRNRPEHAGPVPRNAPQSEVGLLSRGVWRRRASVAGGGGGGRRRRACERRRQAHSLALPPCGRRHGGGNRRPERTEIRPPCFAHGAAQYSAALRSSTTAPVQVGQPGRGAKDWEVDLHRHREGRIGVPLTDAWEAKRVQRRTLPRCVGGPEA